MDIDDNIWKESKQILSVLRAPEEWFESISETVRVVDDELERNVRITLADKPSATNGDSLVIAIQSPRKGIPVDSRVRDQQVGTRALSHKEHLSITRMMVLFRFRTVLRLAFAKGKTVRGTAEWANKVGSRLVELVDSIDTAVNAEILKEVFTKKGHLRGIAKRHRSPSLRREMENLFLLAQTVSERYFKFARLDLSAAAQHHLEYSYAQEREARDYGVRGIRVLRRWFRAPRSLLFIHAPLARLTSHYELRLEPIDGYYVRQQFALTSDHTPEERDVMGIFGHGQDQYVDNIGDELWMSTRRGGWTSGFLFIAHGHLATTRIYGAFRLLEIPPGSTGRAWAGSFLGTIVLFSVFVWSVTHNSPASLIAPEALLALVAAGTAVLDNTMPNRQVFNSPFLPRFSLFLQTILALAASVWLLVRSSAKDVLPFAARMNPQFVAFIDWAIGLLIIFSSLAITIVLSRRVYVAAKTYDEAMLEKDRPHKN